MGKKNKVILPPQLPPEIADEEIVVSDEDLQFVKENRKHVTRVADQKEDAIETLYEKRNKKRSLERETEKNGLEVDPVDALPIKTLDGKLLYRTASKESKKSENASKEDEGTADNGTDKSVVKLTKPERRAKLKKSKKEAKKQVKEPVNAEEVQATPQADVLAEVKEDLSAEEILSRKKSKLAELGMALLADPESNIKSLKDILQISKDEDQSIVKLGLLSLLAVFKDIIPGYRIRLPTEKELEMTVSKAIRKMRFYESTLMSSYKVYLQRLIALEKQSSFQHVAVRCMCSLLDAVPHFNFRENLLAAVINNMSSPDDVTRKLCCTTVKSLFASEGKHGGEATVEAVHLIANLVKLHDCHLHPDTIEVFLSLTFDEDIGKAEFSKGEKKGGKKERRTKNSEESKLQVSNKKRNRKDLMAKTREEVDADLKAASFAPDVLERRRMQSETLSAVFQTYFRILKHTTQTSLTRSKVSTGSSFGGLGANPLLAPCLNGLGKFSHLIDLDFMGDLMNSLKKLASGGTNPDSSPENGLTVSERLRCCIVAFKVMRSNLDALNVDLHEFFVQLYNLLLEYRPDSRDQGEVLAEALKTMLCEGRQHDMQRAAAFIKRLATFSLCFGSAEAMAALVTLRDLLQKNIKCRNLLENDAGGGSLSGSVAKYQPYASDPNQSGALASVLWELSLLSKHYHPKISTAASSISSLTTDPNQVYLSTTTPRQAFMDLSIEQESFNLKGSLGTSNRKRKKVRGSSTLSSTNLKPIQDLSYSVDEDDLRKRLSEHFIVLRDITENERLRRDLNHTVSSIRLYEEYKRQKKRKP
ncbi:CCAAT-binding factor [Macleaya cordata]|uniref:CCAAT-binding factor n=1 Tax=Macleaya cordata TaxID=56857 RepID=A0A200QBN0_MACCD|nr:CCAAT-binding factor [Macleaya cordata]